MPRSDRNAAVVGVTLELVERRFRATVPRGALLALLRGSFPRAPDSAEFAVRVPGGGDWSGGSLVVGVDAELEVSWVEVEGGG